MKKFTSYLLLSIVTMVLGSNALAEDFKPPSSEIHLTFKLGLLASGHTSYIHGETVIDDDVDSFDLRARGDTKIISFEKIKAKDKKVLITITYKITSPEKCDVPVTFFIDPYDYSHLTPKFNTVSCGSSGHAKLFIEMVRNNENNYRVGITGAFY